ncbi:MAG: glycosyl hydrolase 2 galactose-binding domain-containing protein [Candidatus Hodarchaeales archaeon]|jgi:beta-mannosidase
MHKSTHIEYVPKFNNKTALKFSIVANTIFLENWFFRIADIANKDKIVNQIKNKMSIDTLEFNLQPFRIPGTLQSNIVILKNLEPFFEDNMKLFDNLESQILLLVCEIPLKDQISENLKLIFEQIDTISEIYLNGSLLGKVSNAFRQYQFSVPNKILRQGKNLLSLFIFPPMSYVDQNTLLPEIRDRVFVRRPTYNYGWDFAPRAVLVGIREVQLKSEEKLSINDIFVITETCNEKEANILIKWTIETSESKNYLFNLKITTPDDNTINNIQISKDLIVGKNQIQIYFIINDPNLWWPNGSGNQPLYKIEVTEKSTGCSRSSRFGVRQIRLILEEGNKNRFIFEINGEKIWAKGANWVPTNALTNFSNNQNYKDFLKLAKNANFNMIRIWGGGVVEQDAFYDICDDFGLMIWHDFQFACSIYPENEEYLMNVENEIIHVLKKLRNHPSIVLWCGNNENEWIYYQNFPDEYKNGYGIGYKLHILKKRLCEQFDPTRPYWRSSPWSSKEEDPNSQMDGNCHDWYVWHGVGSETPPEYEHYANNQSHFISEFGIQSLPVIETIDKIFSKQTQVIPNKIWKFHNCDLEKIIINMNKFGQPHNLYEWIVFSQAAQAFGLKYAIETWRSRKFKTAGSLIWQFNEPWPTICWSLVDFYCRPKMAYWVVKKVFEPVTLVYDKAEEKIIIINDLFKEINGKLVIRIYKLEGKIITEKTYNISVMPNNKEEISFKSNLLSNNEFMWYEFSFENSCIDNIFLPNDPVNIDFPNPEIELTLNREKKILSLLSKRLAFIVTLPSEIEPNDNYFHIIPEILRTISINQLPLESNLEISVWKYEKKSIPLRNIEE